MKVQIYYEYRLDQPVIVDLLDTEPGKLITALETYHTIDKDDNPVPPKNFGIYRSVHYTNDKPKHVFINFEHLLVVDIIVPE